MGERDAVRATTVRVGDDAPKPGRPRFARGDRERAAELLRRTQSALDSAGIVLDPDDAFEVDWLRDQLDRASADEA
jgi:hypothetical protein